MENNNLKTTQRSGIKWQLVAYDAILLIFVSIALIGIYPSEAFKLPVFDTIIQILLSLVCVLGIRALFGSYLQVWRYARTINYIQLMLCDLIGGMVFFVLQKALPVQDITFNSKGKRYLREFDIEERLFRDVKDFTNDDTRAYYKNKVVLISGGGGSIGSELGR